MFKLDRSNKYVGKRVKKGNNNSFALKIVAGILSGVFVGSAYINFVSHIASDTDVRDIVISSTYMKYKYDDLSNEEKCEYVVNLFCEVVDEIDDISVEQKEGIKGYVSKFLSDWGYLYNNDSILDMEASLYSLNVGVSDELDNGVLGAYIPGLKEIVVVSGDDYSTMAHEFTHAITNCSFNDIIREGITSSIDKKYYEGDSYDNVIRSQVFLLGEIVGRENLIRCYINGGYNELLELIGEDNKDLLDMFDEEYEGINDNWNVDNNLYFNIANKLKDMYESKYGRDIGEDVYGYVMYSSCIPYSSYELDSTLFDDDSSISFSYDGCKVVIDSSNRYNTVNTFRDCFSLMNVRDVDSIINEMFDKVRVDYNNGVLDNNVLYRMRLMFREDVFNSIMDSDDIVNSFYSYLVSMGIGDKDLKYVTYSFLYDNLSREYLVSLYYDKFNYLYENNRLDFAIGDLKLLCREWGIVLNDITDLYDNELVKREVDVYDGFYWEDRKVDYGSSVIGFNRSCISNSIILYDNGINYEFVTNKGIVYPSDTRSNKDGYTYVSFDTDGEVYVYGNRERFTCDELGIGINEERSR